MHIKISQVIDQLKEKRVNLNLQILTKLQLNNIVRQNLQFLRDSRDRKLFQKNILFTGYFYFEFQMIQITKFELLRQTIQILIKVFNLGLSFCSIIILFEINSMHTFRVLLVCTLLTGVWSLNGIQIAQLFHPEVYSCFKNEGIGFASIRGFLALGYIDPQAPIALQRARDANIDSIDTYLFPCRGKNATSQINQMFNYIPNNLFNRVWLGIEHNFNPGCDWGGDIDANCAYVKQLVNAVKARGKIPGIYTTSFLWSGLVGIGGCAQVGSQPLWYVHFDNSSSFKDFKPFGGWTRPTVKSYSTSATLCGQNITPSYQE